MDQMNQNRGPMYMRTQRYSLQTHSVPDKEPQPSTSRENRTQVNAPSQENRGVLYTRTQQYTLQTHSIPDKESMPSTSGENRQQVNAPSQENRGVLYTRTQQYTLQTHGIPDKESMPSTSGENRQQIAEAEEDQNVDAERRRKRMPEKRPNGTHNESPTDPKKQKKAPHLTSAAQQAVRSNEASPDELYFSALGTEDVNPWSGQRTAPMAPDSRGWGRPDAELAGVAAPAEQARGPLQHPGTMYGNRSSGLNLALAECLDSLNGLDPNALYRVEFVPPAPARLTLRRVDAPSLPPPPMLFRYGVPEHSQWPSGGYRQTEVTNPVRSAAPDREAWPNTQQPASGTGCPNPSQRPSYGMDAWPHGPNHCIPLPWIQQQPVKYVKDVATSIGINKQCQTDVEENNGRCCSLINANRVLLRHNAPQNRGQTSVLEVDHVIADEDGPSIFSTPNRTGNPRIRQSGTPRPQRSMPDLDEIPNTPRVDTTREVDLSESDSSNSASFSEQSCQNTSCSSFPNTPKKR